MTRLTDQQQATMSALGRSALARPEATLDAVAAQLARRWRKGWVWGFVSGAVVSATVALLLR